MDSEKVALIGAGAMGRFHLRILDRLGVLAAVVDTVETVAQNFGKQYKVPYFTSIPEMMNTVKPSGVIIATPTRFHYSLAKELIESYSFLKGILIEKPVTKKRTEAVELQKLAQEHGIKLVVGHVEVYNPIVIKALELISAGNLGEIRNIVFHRRGAVAESRLPSIGDIFEDLGVHDFDIAAKLLKGRIYLSCDSLKKQEFHNTTTIVLSSPTKNCTITFLLSREYAGKKRQIEIQGTKGTMIVDLLGQIITTRGLGQTVDGVASVSVPFKGGQLIKVYGEPLQEELYDFVETLKLKDHKPKVGIADGINTLTIVEAAFSSLAAVEHVQVELI